MPSLMLAAKAAVPIVLVAAGVALAATAPGSTPSSAAGTAWIDAPTSALTVPEGTVRVEAHASGPRQIHSLTLSVDGHPVARTDTVVRTGRLVDGHLVWTAASGRHVLTVRDDLGATSASVTVVVIGSQGPSSGPSASATPTARESTTTTPRPSATTTGTSRAPAPTTPMPTTSTPTTSTTGAPPRTTPAAPTSTAPVTSAPPGGPSSAPGRPVIGPVTADPATLTWYCGPDDLTVSGAITGATSATVTLDGRSYPMTHEASGWTVTIAVDDIGTAADRTDTHVYPVGVQATGPGGSSLARAGTVTIETCKP